MIHIHYPVHTEFLNIVNETALILTMTNLNPKDLTIFIMMINLKSFFIKISQGITPPPRKGGEQVGYLIFMVRL